jgi:DNA invertase Pin-like site-specific DNA recombinase
LDLKAREIGSKNLTENIDTTTPAGELVFHMFGALAQFERNLIRERTNAGLRAARARGRKGGRKSLLDATKIALARELYEARDEHGRPKHAIGDICSTLGVSKTTLWRYVKGRPARAAPLRP